MLQTVDHLRKQVSASTSREDKSALGQFLTPSSVAQFMASLFPSDGADPCRPLDAGAGVGALSAVFLDRCREDSLSFPSIELSAYEIDTPYFQMKGKQISRPKIDITPIYLYNFKVKHGECVMKKSKATSKIKGLRNPVAHFINDVNKPATHIDRKKQMKNRGVSRRGKWVDVIELFAA